MKEASGEASTTVITIVLIGVIAAAGAILIPALLNNANQSTNCGVGQIYSSVEGKCISVPLSTDTNKTDTNKKK